MEQMTIKEYNNGKCGLDLWLERNATKAQRSELKDLKLSYEAVLEGSRSSRIKSAKLREIDGKRQAIFEQINASNILNNSENDTQKPL